MLTPETRIVRLPDLIASDMSGDLVMMSIERGEYYGISGVGTRIWELIEHPAKIEDLTGAIMREFDIDLGTCSDDVLRFAGELIDRGLVKVC